MSRINNLFHPSNCQNSTPADPIKVNGSEDNIANGFVDGSSTNFLDQLKPKIKEIVQEIITEEEKLVKDVKQCDIENALRKIPALPTVASKLPEPIKNWIKKLISRIEASKPEAPSTESAVHPAVQSEAPKLVSEAAPAPPTTNNVPATSE